MYSKVLVYCDKPYETNGYRFTFRDFGRRLTVDDMYFSYTTQFILNTQVTSNDLKHHPLNVIREYRSFIGDLVKIYHNGVITLRLSFSNFGYRTPVAFYFTQVKGYDIVNVAKNNKGIAFSINM